MASLSEAIAEITSYLNLDPLKFAQYCEEDNIGGATNTNSGEWYIGSIYGVEGKILYALTRALHPRIVLEFGTFHGCSTTHFYKALEKNRCGKIVTVDIAPVAGEMEKYSKRVKQIRAEGIQFAKEWESPPIDIVFEDTAHSAELTREIFKACIPHLRSGGILVAHDTEHFLACKEVRQGFREAVGDFLSILIEPSDCGLGMWKKP